VTAVLIAICCFFFFLVFYTYFGYPLFLLIISSLFQKSVKKGDVLPKVSIIIAAYNEEKIIKEKIENSLGLNYPDDLIEIIVASDHSTDQTDQIVAEFEPAGVILAAQSERNGKTMALNHAVNRATGEILIFTDATAILEKDCIQQIVKNFNDPQVGCVCPEMRYNNVHNNNITQIEGLYWKYESCLKHREAMVGSLAFVPGACFAVRRELHSPVEPEYDYDCIVPLEVIARNHRVVYEREACFAETMVTSSKDLFKSKIRMITKDFSGTLSRKKLLNPFVYPWVSLTLLSHKLIRWLVPFFLIIVLISNVLLIHIEFFKFLLLGQLIYYFMAFVGLVLKQRKGFLSIPFYFCIVNLAALIGVCKAILGEKIPFWQPVR